MRALVKIGVIVSSSSGTGTSPFVSQSAAPQLVLATAGRTRASSISSLAFSSSAKSNATIHQEGNNHCFVDRTTHPRCDGPFLFRGRSLRGGGDGGSGSNDPIDGEEAKGEGEDEGDAGGGGGGGGGCLPKRKTASIAQTIATTTIEASSGPSKRTSSATALPSSSAAANDATVSVFPPSDVPTFSADALWLTRRLGTGKFSDVFEAVHDHNQQLVVVKCLKPVSDRKVRREVAVLRHAQQQQQQELDDAVGDVDGAGAGAVNVVRLLGVVMHNSERHSDNDCHPRNSPTPMPSLVLEHAGPNSQWLCHPVTSATTTATSSSSTFPLSEYEIRYYVCHLLAALRDLHKLGIMHRDVKPRNVLINRGQHLSASHPYNDDVDSSSSLCRPLLLIDLGLADFYTPHAPYNVRVASRHYKSPELLLGYPYYTPSLDLWGVGCVLAGLLLRREPFFRGRDNPDQLLKIVAVLGTRDLDRYVAKYGIPHPAPTRPTTDDASVREEDATAWQSLPMERVDDWNAMRGPDCPTPPAQGLDLLNHLLVYDHEGRYTAQQAMDHPFFDPVRERVHAEIRALRQVEQWKRHKKMSDTDPVRKELGLHHVQVEPMSSSAAAAPVPRPVKRPVPESALSFLSSPHDGR